MKSAHLATASALLLLATGLCLLFVPDTLLPVLIEGYPRSGAWLGQVAGAGCLSVAALNWMTRGTIQGGIFGRPIVNANLTLYFITFGSIVRAASQSNWPITVTTAAVVAGVMAAAYAWLMFTGPLPADETRPN